MTDKISRIIILSNRVDHVSAGKVIEQIYKINEEDDRDSKNTKSYTREPIKLIVSTYGGSVNSMYAIISAMLESRTPVYTHVPGYAMSAGLDIVMAGEPGHRTASEFATFMLHDASYYIEGKSEELKDEIGKIKVDTKRMIDFYVRFSKMTKKMVKDMIKSTEDIYLTPIEALELGIIDNVIGFVPEN